ncbi:5885_t:CDS:1, partial [Dentiscutata erythropus]
KSASSNPILAKARRIDRSSPGYNVEDLTDLFDDNDNEQDIVNASNDTVTFNPAAIIRSGLKNVRTVDTAINILRIRGRFLTKNYTNLTGLNDSININNLDPNVMRSSDSNDDNLLKMWQNTITSHKTTFRHNNIPIFENEPLLNTF